MGSSPSPVKTRPGSGAGMGDQKAMRRNPGINSGSTRASTSASTGSSDVGGAHNETTSTVGSPNVSNSRQQAMLKNTASWTHEEQKSYLISLHIVSLPGEEPVLRFLADALAEALLPVPWAMLRDAHGRVCFANQSTGVAEWNHPLEPSLRELAGAVRVCLTLPSALRKSCISSLHETWEREARSEFTKWYSVKHESGRAYYCHRETREAMWEHPAEVVLPAHYLKIKSIERLLDDAYFESICAAPAMQTLTNEAVATAGSGQLALANGDLTMLPGNSPARQGAQGELEAIRSELEQQLRQAMESQRALHDELSSAEKDLVSAKATSSDDRKRASQAEAELAEERASAAKSRAECEELSRAQMQALESVKEMEIARKALEAKLAAMEEEQSSRRALGEARDAMDEDQRIDDTKLLHTELSQSRDYALERAERAERMMHALESRLAAREQEMKDHILEAQNTPSTPSRIMDSGMDFPTSPSSAMYNSIHGTHRLDTLSECPTPTSEGGSTLQPGSAMKQLRLEGVEVRATSTGKQAPPPLILESEVERATGMSSQERLRSELVEAQRNLLEAKYFIAEIQDHSAQAEVELREERKRVQNTESEMEALSRSRDTALQRAQNVACANRALEERLAKMRKALPFAAGDSAKLPIADGEATARSRQSMSDVLTVKDEQAQLSERSLKSMSDVPTVKEPVSPELEYEVGSVKASEGLRPEELAAVAELSLRAAEGGANDVDRIEAELVKERQRAQHVDEVEQAKVALEARLAEMERVLRERDFALAASYVERTVQRVAWHRAKEVERKATALVDRRDQEPAVDDKNAAPGAAERERSLLAESASQAAFLQARLEAEQQRCAELEAANKDLDARKRSLELLLLTAPDKPDGPPEDDLASDYVFPGTRPGSRPLTPHIQFASEAEGDKQPVEELRDLVAELRAAVNDRPSAEASRQADRIEALQASLREEQERRAELEQRQAIVEANRRSLEDRLWAATVSNEQFKRKLEEIEEQKAAEASRQPLQPSQGAPSAASQPVAAAGTGDAAELLVAERQRVQNARLQCAELLKTVVDVLVRAEQADSALDARQAMLPGQISLPTSPAAAVQPPDPTIGLAPPADRGSAPQPLEAEVEERRARVQEAVEVAVQAQVARSSGPEAVAGEAAQAEAALAPAAPEKEVLMDAGDAAAAEPVAAKEDEAAAPAADGSPAAEQPAAEQPEAAAEAPVEAAPPAPAPVDETPAAPQDDLPPAQQQQPSEVAAPEQREDSPAVAELEPAVADPSEILKAAPSQQQPDAEQVLDGAASPVADEAAPAPSEPQPAATEHAEEAAALPEPEVASPQEEAAAPPEPPTDERPQPDEAGAPEQAVLAEAPAEPVAGQTESPQEEAAAGTAGVEQDAKADETLEEQRPETALVLETEEGDEEQAAKEIAEALGRESLAAIGQDELGNTLDFEAVLSPVAKRPAVDEADLAGPKAEPLPEQPQAAPEQQPELEASAPGQDAPEAALGPAAEAPAADEANVASPQAEPLPEGAEAAAEQPEPEASTPRQSLQEALSEARRELDHTKASSDLMQQRAAQAARELEQERQRVELSRRECAELSKERATALASIREAERTRAELEAKLARAEKALQLTNEGKAELLADDELFRDLHESLARQDGDSSPKSADSPSKKHAAEAEAALAEEKKRTESVLKEYEKISADHTSAMDSLKEAERAKSALAEKLATVEQLLKSTEATLAAEASVADEAVTSLQAEVKQQSESRAQLERANAELDAKQLSLQSDIHKALASTAALKEELVKKESEARAAKAGRSAMSDEMIREQARKLADNVITVQALPDPLNEEAEQVEEPMYAEARKELSRLPLGSEAYPSKSLRNAAASSSTPKKHRKLPKSPERERSRKHRSSTRSEPLADKDALVAASKGEELHHRPASRDLDKKLRELERRHSSQTSEPASVNSTLKVKNVDYAQLCASPAMLSSFKDSLRKALASAAGPGVRPEHVELVLSAGSVVVQARISLPKGVPAKDVASQLKSAPIESTVVAAVAAVEGIETVSSGPIAVSEVRVSVPEPPVLPAEATKVQEQPVWRPEGGAHKERSSSRPNRDGKAQREREARRARRALEDAIVLASRIQLLRAEGARTRKKIHQAMEKKTAVVAASSQVVKRRGSGGSAAELLEASEPQTAQALTLADRVVQNKEALLKCNAVLKAELQVIQERQAQGVAPAAAWPDEGSGPDVSTEVRASMAASRRGLGNFNLAVRIELEQLAGQLSELLRQRGELRQRAARPCWETPAAA